MLTPFRILVGPLTKDNAMPLHLSGKKVLSQLKPRVTPSPDRALHEARERLYVKNSRLGRQWHSLCMIPEFIRHTRMVHTCMKPEQEGAGGQVFPFRGSLIQYIVVVHGASTSFSGVNFSPLENHFLFYCPPGSGNRFLCLKGIINNECFGFQFCQKSR